MSFEISRRMLLQAGLSGLVIACHVEPPKPPAPPVPGAPSTSEPKATPSAEPFAPNAWVRVAPDGAVTIVIDKSEMGQGTETGIAMLVADELDCDWSKIKVEQAPVDPPKYKNLMFGMQAVGGSTSIRAGYDSLRRAGAAARAMLVAAAAKEWGVDASACTADKGEVVHAASGKRLGFGALAEKAKALPVPQEPPLKRASDFKLIGKNVPRLDGMAKATGRAGFGIDVARPGMLTAVVVRPPKFGGKVKTFDGKDALAVKGVQKVVPIESGVAVVADHFWAARKGARALKVDFDDGPNAAQSSERIAAEAATLVKKAGKVAETKGDVEKAFKGKDLKTIEAVYEAPFQAHAAMEPMCCAAEAGDKSCDIWAPTQFQEGCQKVAMKVTGLSAEAIRVHTTYLGGGFGRKFEIDAVTEALQVAKATGKPVKVMWTREDDMRHDFYRPVSYHALRGAVGRDGVPVAWSHRIVSPSIMTRVFPHTVKDGLDKSSVEGATELPYALPNVSVDYHLQDTGIPVGFWRSVGHSQNAFVTESFLDELAALGKQDPFELRKKLLAGSPRLLAALTLAAEKAGWGKPLGSGKGRGIAAHISFGSYVAQVAEVTVGKDNAVKVDRVVCAIDCGRVVNPDLVACQIESAVAFGMTAALKAKITIEGGRVKESNFHEYKLLRIDEMPAVEVHIVPSDEKPGGVGEPGTPPVAPAVTNAIFAATGKRVRSLPVKL